MPSDPDDTHYVFQRAKTQKELNRLERRHDRQRRDYYTANRNSQNRSVEAYVELLKDLGDVEGYFPRHSRPLKDDIKVPKYGEVLPGPALTGVFGDEKEQKEMQKTKRIRTQMEKNMQKTKRIRTQKLQPEVKLLF